VFEEYHLSKLQEAAAKKFIKDKVGNPDDHTVDRLRDWLFMRINGRKMPAKYHPRQLGCPDLVPGLSLKGFWNTDVLPWIKELEAAHSVIVEELNTLRETSGF